MGGFLNHWLLGVFSEETEWNPGLPVSRLEQIQSKPRQTTDVLQRILAGLVSHPALVIDTTGLSEYPVKTEYWTARKMSQT